MRLYLFRLGTVRPTGAPIPGALIQTDDGRNVLVDTGARRPEDGGVAAGPPLRVAAGEVITAQLERIGLAPGDVSTVVCTHLDPDHAGYHDAFPYAEFVVQRAHYEQATSGEVSRFEAARPFWDRPELRYRTVDGDVRLLPGIELVESSGHVAGHQSVLVRLPDTGAVLLAGDAIPMAAAADPDRRPVTPFDLDGASVRASTRRLVELAEREKALVVYGHDARQWEDLATAPSWYS